MTAPVYQRCASEGTQPNYSTKPVEGWSDCSSPSLRKALAASKEPATPFVPSSRMTLPCCLLSYPLTSRRK